MKTVYIDDSTVELIRRNLPLNQWLLLQVAAETGIRIGDVVALRRCNLGKQSILYRASKNGKGQRVKLSSELTATLKQQTPILSAFLFPSPYKKGKHITRQAAWQRVKRACIRAGQDPAGIAPHSFRKYFAVEVFRQSGIRAAQRALNHDRPETTEIYALSDFSTGSNADKPLLRRDLQLIIETVISAVQNRSDK